MSESKAQHVLDQLDVKGLAQAYHDALRDAAIYGSGFIMLSAGEDCFEADYLSFEVVKIDVKKLEAETANGETS